VALQPVWEVHAEPSRDGLGQGGEDDLVELSILEQPVHRLDRVRVPEVAVGIRAQDPQVVEELAQPMLGVLGVQTIGGRVAGGRGDGGALEDAAGKLSMIGVRTST
jgi:hypothetical protein